MDAHIDEIIFQLIIEVETEKAIISVIIRQE